MNAIFTAEEMRAYEGYLMETLGIPSLLLMEILTVAMRVFIASSMVGD